MTMIIRSTAFADGQRIPLRHTGDGEDVSPPLQWVNLPGGTRELALIVDDPDAPAPEPWVHWIIYRIPGSVQELPEAIPRYPSINKLPGAMQGNNSWDSIGYRGPAPPRGHGLHHYHFRLYALDAALHLAPNLDKKAVLKAMESHILDQGILTGVYQR
jgi:Raf kinase inhibitor-like YbhB/YbcL family protein